MHSQVPESDFDVDLLLLHATALPPTSILLLLILPNMPLQVPESDLDLDTLYHKLMQPTGQLQALLEQQHCSISPEISSSALGGARSDREGSPGSCSTPAGLYADLFKWYDRNKSGAIEQDELQVRGQQQLRGCLHMWCARLTACAWAFAPVSCDSCAIADADVGQASWLPNPRWQACCHTILTIRTAALLTKECAAAAAAAG
jgi:hypothetical protein